MLFEYNRVAEKYKEAFVNYECSLKIELKWDNYLSIKRKMYDYRLPLQIGYRRFIDFMVQKDGEELKLISDDGEADYYSYGESVNVTWIHWLWGEKNFFCWLVSEKGDLAPSCFMKRQIYWQNVRGDY